jgi:flagellar assembly factor FliW
MSAAPTHPPPTVSAGGYDPGNSDDVVALETRFGRLELPVASLIMMPSGMLGFGNLRRFGLTDLPAQGPMSFKLYQSVEDAAVSFIVLPINPGDDMLDAKDADAAFRNLGINPEEGVCAVVVSPQRGGGVVSFTVNTRAPVIFDSQRLLAWQYVMNNPRYQVRQPLT